jgi:hypothetical protein
VKQCWIGVHDSYANPITLTMMDLSEVSESSSKITITFTMMDLSEVSHLQKAPSSSP